MGLINILFETEQVPLEIWQSIAEDKGLAAGGGWKVESPKGIDFMEAYLTTCYHRFPLP